jgi:hypothetical protein
MNARKIVTYKLDLNNLPPLTESQKAELAALAARPDSEIDLSDAPELTDEQWKNAIRHRFYRPSNSRSPRGSTAMCCIG